MPDTADITFDLERYVPRVATEWERDAAGRNWQELDGTLCFVDISGFTKLSERLARRGRIGAEELTDVLNRVFGNMLEMAYLQGGSLLKFGGDALLLMFVGHDHAARGASAAVEMRSALRQAAQYTTSVGRLRLRMSTGIHTGPIHLFRAGSSHQELVIAGPGGTTTTTMEKQADPGEILVSAGTRDALPPDAAPKAKGNGWLLKWRKPHCIAPGPVTRTGTDPELVQNWVPTALRDYLGAGTPEPEHRVAGVGFVRFCGIDHLMATEGPDEVGARIHRTIEIVQHAADRESITFLATDINEDGGKVILVAGAPTARDEDEGRLLRALRSIADSDAPLDIHIGVNRGHVFTGEVGAKYRATYTVMGDTVNLAARLMAAAPAGAVYATPGILDRSATLFATHAVEPFHVKGKAELVHAYDMGHEIGERTADTRTELPFRGRRRELAMLEGAIAATRSGSGTVVAVIGETGTGKSRLIREACRSDPDLRTISIRSEPYGATTPYRPLRDALRGLLEIERDEQPAMARKLEERVAEVEPDLLPLLPLLADVAHIDVAPTPEASAIEPRFRQDRLADAIMRLLDRLLTGPTVLDVEDAHWMDDASTHLVSRISADVADRPWAVLLTRRGTEGGCFPEGCEVIELTELAPPEAEALVIEATAAAPLRPHEIKIVVARGGGNPLFLGEILRVVRETGSVDALPDSLGTVVSTSIDALPALARRILRYASVLGRSFRTDVVRDILAEDQLELDASTRRALRRFLVADGRGRLRFSTAMVRDVAYDGLSFRRRRQLHLRAAAALERSSANPEDAADLLSMHYSLGNEPKWCWHYARIAGDRARRSFANVDAAVHYERALDSARRLPKVSDEERADVWTDLGDVREQAGLFDDALDAYRRAYRLVGDDALAQARLLLRRAGARERAGQYPVALRETTKAKQIVQSVGSRDAARWRAEATAFAATVRQRQERPREALREAETAAEEAREAGEKAALARAYSVISWAHLMLDMPGAGDLYRQALALFEELDDHAGQAHMNNNLGGLAYFEGKWNEALEYYERGRAESERLGDVRIVGWVETNIGEVLVNQGYLDEAERVLRNASRVLRAIGFLFGAVFADMQLGRALTAKGDTPAAEELLSAVRSEVIELGFSSGAYEAALYLAECLIGKGEPEAALDVLEEAAAAGSEDASIYAPTEARVRATALIALGRDDDAAEHVKLGLDEARARGVLYEVALLLQLEAALVEDSRARTDALDEATAILNRLGVRADAVRATSSA